jgi:hypothetical protein
MPYWGRALLIVLFEEHRLVWGALKIAWKGRTLVLNFWEQFIVSAVSGILRAAVKNPTRFAGMEQQLIHVRDDATQIVSALDPHAPDPPGYKAL